ncbi:MAG: hypothetical protein P8099_12005 [Gemmatimonadota bacterium]|jgi:hypothetical protein
MRLRILLPLVLLPAALLSLAACSHDTTGPTDPLVANYEADPRCLWDCWFTVRSVSNPADTLNLTNQFSARFELDLQSNGSYQMQLSAPGVVDPYQDNGSFTSTGSLLILSGTDGVDTVDYQLNSPLLRLSFRKHFALTGLFSGTDTVSVQAMLKKF